MLYREAFYRSDSCKGDSPVNGAAAPLALHLLVVLGIERGLAITRSIFCDKKLSPRSARYYVG